MMPLSLLGERFRVSCLPNAADVARRWRASHVISLLDPELPDHLLPIIQNGEHIIARLRDQENLKDTSRFPDIVVSLFETVRPAAENRSSRILVHCHMGVSRSTAFAYSMIAYRAGPGNEYDAFNAFLSIVNKPWPNRRIVEILDQYLGRGGRLVAPLDEMRARMPFRLEAYRRLNSRRGLPEGSGVYER
ncbi:protein tyrosine phosphatase [Rhizobium sp. L1K21]|uniref:protein tyrosine phosphatase n=1 Tax=Rhizobium sp. L1K21 TaxID=2954933 RepID=UPI00209344E4|nr:protein tyrosine phosphatase [Rhizobium sp. L1K21]MCO6185478.1 protein tyrosine phosphatase [Rhizobium sp. L1K21]